MRFAAPLVLLMLAGGSLQAQELQPPCSANQAAAYTPPGAAPAVSVLRDSDLSAWQAPACAGWAGDARARLVVSLSGSFRFAGTMDELLARIGEISRLAAIPYWSARDKKWEPLAKQASALTGPDAKERRDDFTADDFKPGTELYYWQDDALTGGTVYELNVYERSPERVVIGTDNVTPVRKSIFSLFRPGASRSALFLQRIRPGVFGATIVASAMQGSSSLVQGHEQIYVNRARALFNFLAANNPDQAQLALSDR